MNIESTIYKQIAISKRNKVIKSNQTKESIQVAKTIQVYNSIQILKSDDMPPLMGRVKSYKMIQQKSYPLIELVDMKCPDRRQK